MSKKCAVCGEKISILSENKLGENTDVKICFTCYEYAATAMKGNRKAINLLRNRHKEDIADKVVKYIDSLDVDIAPKNKNNTRDEFMDLMDNDLSNLKKKEEKTNSRVKTKIVRLDKLPEAKKDKLIRLNILSTVLFFVFPFLGLLFSFYILVQGYGVILATVVASVSIGIAFLL